MKPTRVFLSIRSHCSKKDYRVIRYRAVWVVRGTGGCEIYESSVRDSKEEVKALAYKWLAKANNCIDTTEAQ